MIYTISYPGGVSAGRLQWIYIAKALAAWMVVTSHLLREGMLTDFLAAFSVSLFFMLSGVTLHPHEDIAGFVQQRIRRVVIPYLAVGLISIMAYRVLGSYAAARLDVNIASTTIWQDLRNLLYGSSVGGRMKWNESLWFLPCYFVMILVAEGIEHVGQRSRILRFVLYAVSGGVGYTLIVFGCAGLPWHVETALLVLPICGLGTYLQKGLRAQRMNLTAMCIVGLAWMYIGVRTFESVLREADWTFSLRAPRLAGIEATYLFLLATSAGALYVICGATLTRRLPHVLSYVGEHSLDIVLWNKFPVLVLQVIVPVFLPGFDRLFVGYDDALAFLVAGLLAIPCIAVCLVWELCCRHGMERMWPHELPSDP